MTLCSQESTETPLACCLLTSFAEEPEGPYGPWRQEYFPPLGNCGCPRQASLTPNTATLRGVSRVSTASRIKLRPPSLTFNETDTLVLHHLPPLSQTHPPQCLSGLCTFTLAVCAAWNTLLHSERPSSNAVFVRKLSLSSTFCFQSILHQCYNVIQCWRFWFPSRRIGSCVSSEGKDRLLGSPA